MKKVVEYLYILNILLSPEGPDFVNFLYETNTEIKIEDIEYIFLKGNLMREWDDKRIDNIAINIYNKQITGEIKIPETTLKEKFSSHKHSILERHKMHAMHSLFMGVLSSANGLLFLEMIEKKNSHLFHDEELRKKTAKAKKDYKAALKRPDDGRELNISRDVIINLASIALYLTWFDSVNHLRLNAATIHLLSEATRTRFFNPHFQLA